MPEDLLKLTLFRNAARDRPPILVLDVLLKEFSGEVVSLYLALSWQVFGMHLRVFGDAVRKIGQNYSKLAPRGTKNRPRASQMDLWMVKVAPRGLKESSQ